jgi:hypothetical protein
MQGQVYRCEGMLGPVYPCEDNSKRQPAYHARTSLPKRGHVRASLPMLTREVQTTQVRTNLPCEGSVYSWEGQSTDARACEG